MNLGMRADPEYQDEQQTTEPYGGPMSPRVFPRL
jgi:hypothetical protein